MHRTSVRLTTENVVDFEKEMEHEEQLEFERKLAKMRDCSGLTAEQKRKHEGEAPDLNSITKNTRHASRRFSHRKLYATYGVLSGVNPGVMWPSKPELEELKEIDRDWSPNFHQLKQTLEEKKRAEEEDLRLREEKVDKALAKMPALIKQFQEKQKKEDAGDKVRSQRVQDLMDQFREKYGFSVTRDSPKFKAFRALKDEEMKMKKRQEAQLSKKQQQQKNIDMLLEKGSGSKY